MRPLVDALFFCLLTASADARPGGFVPGALKCAVNVNAELARRGEDAKTALVVDLIEPVPGEFYFLFGPGDQSCERWLLTESHLRYLGRKIVQKVL